jgi:hypothetical protein
MNQWMYPKAACVQYYDWNTNFHVIENHRLTRPNSSEIAETWITIICYIITSSCTVLGWNLTLNSMPTCLATLHWSGIFKNYFLSGHMHIAQDWPSVHISSKHVRRQASWSCPPSVSCQVHKPTIQGGSALGERTGAGWKQPWLVGFRPACWQLFNLYPVAIISYLVLLSVAGK